MAISWNELDFTNEGTYLITLELSRNDGTTYYQPIAIDLDFGCVASVAATAGEQFLGEFDVNGSADDSVTNLHLYFTPNPLGCLPTYSMTYGGAAMPAWLTFFVDNTDPYVPVPRISFTENFDYTHIGPHYVELTVLLQDGKTATKNMRIDFSYGCVDAIGVDSAVTTDLGTYDI